MRLKDDYMKNGQLKAAYGSEQNIKDVTLNRLRTALITYNMYRKEKKKKYKNNPFNTANWDYDAEKDAPNGQAVTYFL
ncbi:hypothetical protein [Oceanobacillus sp. CFH 90083]|uniref:hypothetical protein n=1 Tax=Oceanobacillus sp. CFH 90083 TaxID=2592336 RepID=UPI00128E6599|nr:hypothetical protein [Oceanobacillus sp. CFH 90083]